RAVDDAHPVPIGVTQPADLAVGDAICPRTSDDRADGHRLRIDLEDTVEVPDVPHQIARGDNVAAVGGRGACVDLVCAHAFPVGELVGDVLDLGEYPLAVVPARSLVGLDVLLAGLLVGVQGPGVSVAVTFEAAQLGGELVNPPRDRDRGVTTIGGLGCGIDAAPRGGGGALGCHGLAECVPGLLHRAAVPGLAVVADLDRFAALGQRIMCGLVCGPRGLGSAGLAVGLGIECIDAGGLAGDLVGFDVGGGPVGVVDVDVDSETGCAQRGGRRVDLGQLGAAIPRLRD